VEVEGNQTEYSEQGRDMDLDGDGISNLDERLTDQDPLPSETVDVPGVEAPASENPGTENPDTENPDTENPGTENPGNVEDIPVSVLNITAGNNSESFTVGMAETLEQPLLEGSLDIGDLSPDVKVSFGDNETPVTMQREDDNSWNGEFNANSAGVYKVELVWVEEYEGRPLELTSRSFDVAIGEDNSIALVGGTGWDINFDDDDDGPSNLISDSLPASSDVDSSTASLPIDFATGPGIGPDGLRRANFEQDVYELRIPLEAAGISTDSPFGFELHINDDDDGQTRDSRWGWMQSATSNNDIDDGLLARPIMGTLMLE